MSAGTDGLDGAEFGGAWERAVSHRQSADSGEQISRQTRLVQRARADHSGNARRTSRTQFVRAVCYH